MSLPLSNVEIRTAGSRSGKSDRGKRDGKGGYGGLQVGLFYPGDGALDTPGCLLFELCYQLRHLAM